MEIKFIKILKRQFTSKNNLYMFKNILETIGNTPIIEINKLNSNKKIKKKE